MSKKDNIEFTFDDVDNELNFDELDSKILIEDEPAEAPEVEQKDEDKDEDKDEELHEEYLVIYDSIMFEDKFEKEYKLGKKYSTTFSTRSTDADIRVSRQLDNMDFSTMHALQTMSAVLTMSHSLMTLNGVDLSEMSVAERYNFIRGKSSHLIEILSKHMIDFDALVRNALAYGETNF